MGWMAPLRHLGAKMPVGQKPPANREPSMNEITTVGLDLAKNVFQVHGVDAEGTTVLRKQLRRAQVLAFFSRLPRCLVGMEACATAHYWARELRTLGHEVRLMPAQYVKAYVKRNKNDAADAEAICEAVGRPTMRFVTVKTAEQQAANQYLRRLLINGASANLLRSKATNADPSVIGLRQRRPSLVVAVALANKTARIAWAVMHRQENYQRMATAA